MQSQQPQPTECLEAVCDHSQLTTIFHECVSLAEVEALNQNDIYCKKVFRGTYAHNRTIRHLAFRLEPLGFVHDEHGNQSRLIAPNGLLPYPMRFLACRGKLEHGGFRVNRKGVLTRSLVEVENIHHAGTPSLFPECVPDTLWANVWIVTQIGKNGSLQVHLALPGDVTEDGCFLECVDHRLIHETNLNEIHIPTPATPESVPQIILLQENG